MARSHVRKREAEAIVAYAVAVCDLLRMPGWRVMVMEEPADDDDQASINWIDQKHTARIYLNRNWMTYDDDTRRECITHEVMHLLHAKVSTVVLDDSQAYMHDHEHADWSRRVRREFELMVDHLAVFMTNTHSLEEAWAAVHQR